MWLAKHGDVNFCQEAAILSVVTEMAFYAGKFIDAKCDGRTCVQKTLQETWEDG